MIPLTLFWGFGVQAQYQDVGVGFARLHLPFSAESARGAEVHYRFAWSGRWSATGAFSYQQATIQREFEFDRNKARLTFGESCALLDLYVARRFFMSSPLRLLGGIGFSAAYLSAQEGEISIVQSSVVEKNFRRRRNFATYLSFPFEMGVPLGERASLALRPVFRFPILAQPEPLEFTITSIDIGQWSRSSSQYIPGSVISFVLSLSYRIY
ncbi:MAG: hypothetical protein RMJ33_08445 [Saprospiraceae bacterium]|nr:hypothetical protein [Saprospiraceae bacterium]MDW8229853.1 hypothetical protein [Saprospiraceae bacterium]